MRKRAVVFAMMAALMLPMTALADSERSVVIVVVAENNTTTVCKVTSTGSCVEVGGGKAGGKTGVRSSRRRTTICQNGVCNTTISSTP